MRQRRQRADHRQLADVALAEIALQAPDRDQDIAGYAELLLNARQQRGMALQQRLAAIDAAGADPGRDVLLKALVEGVALASVEGEHRAILLHTAERRAGHARRDAGSLRFRGHAGDKAIEVAAAARGLRRSAGQTGDEGDGQGVFRHSDESYREWAGSGARSCPGTGFASKRQILARTDRCLPATNQMRSPPP